MTFKCRNDFVLIRVVDVGMSEGGVAIPQISIQGKEFHVEAVGPDVNELEVGDKVMMIGKQWNEYYPLPNCKDLLVIKQEFIVLVLEEKG